MMDAGAAPGDKYHQYQPWYHLYSDSSPAQAVVIGYPSVLLRHGLTQPAPVLHAGWCSACMLTNNFLNNKLSIIIF